MTSLALPPKTDAKMTGSVDGILSTPCLVGGLGFVNEAARRPNYFLILSRITCTNGQGYNTAWPGISLEDDPPYPSRAQALAHWRSIMSNLSAQPEVGSASRALLASKSGLRVIQLVTRSHEYC